MEEEKKKNERAKMTVYAKFKCLQMYALCM